MILYVVHGNTYYDGYGHIENIFGIYTEKYAAEAAKDLRIKELYEKEIARRQMTIVENVSDIEVNILEIEVRTNKKTFISNTRDKGLKSSAVPLFLPWNP